MRLAKDLMAATSAPLVLAILSEGESYGYAIIARVRELSGGEIEWTDGLLYPLLHRLEGAELVASHWGNAESGRKRRYYEITDAGRDELAEHRRQWRTATTALSRAHVLARAGAIALPWGHVLPRTRRITRAHGVGLAW